MTTMIDAPPPTLAEVSAIADPEARAKAARVLFEDADRALSDARRRRDDACLHLLRNEGWKPVRIYRLASLSRRLFGPIAATVPIGHTARKVKHAEEVAETEGKRFWEAKAHLAEVAEVRRQAARDMLAAGYRNVDVHTASGLSTGWVTQASKE